MPAACKCDSPGDVCVHKYDRVYNVAHDVHTGIQRNVLATFG